MDFSSLVPTLEQYGAPLLAKLLSAAAYAAGGPVIGAIATTVMNALADALGAQFADPVSIQAKIAADPAKAQAALQKVESAHAATIQAALQQAQVDEQNTENARATEMGLVASKSVLAMAAPVVSIIVVAGFVGLCILVLLKGAPDSQVFNMLLGTWATGFATVLNFYLGSSAQSAAKGDQIASIAITSLKKK